MAWVFAWGCHSDETSHPIIPGGPSGPIGGGASDARAGDAAPDGGVLHGRACLVADLRNTAACAAMGAGDLTVALGTSTATTIDSGEFSIAVPAASSVVWRVTGDSVQPSLAPFSAVTTIPVIKAADYQNLEGEHGVLEVAGEGAILVHVVAGGTPVEGAIATTTPIGTYAALYDGAAARLWTQNSTGGFGAIWIPGLPSGSVSLEVTPPGGNPQVFAGIPVAEASLTFVTVELTAQN